MRELVGVDDLQRVGSLWMLSEAAAVIDAADLYYQRLEKKCRRKNMLLNSAMALNRALVDHGIA